MTKKKMIAEMRKLGLFFRGWLDGKLMFESDSPSWACPLFEDWRQVGIYIDNQCGRG